ncbi:ABC transporter ATP-binding protein [Nocardioides coralli]|uniref:ABC transporter ATP-binding protein n=1 Tax=Nocardioides coralli TaxID=2872154 RepID=UPI001CA426C9|nr:ABC transporter ATP-binding protein [Nocardioides coralli]QZY29970.1 ABC transporter ATP-binding protein [Nocardioides coralli]
MSRVELEGVAYAFGEVRAVDGVELTVPQGSLTAVLGSSGCGKTTLLRVVAGFLAPQAGTVRFDDQVVAGPGTFVAPQRRRVGYVPQEGALFPHLDVAANIGFGLPRAERRSERVAEMLDLVELPASFATRWPHELSGGQQQRVALARALAPGPSIVLLDEPFSSLDASLRVSTGRAVAHALQATGTTALLVTHDQDEALSLADQVAVMRHGRVIQTDAPRELYRAPVDPDVGAFVGGATVVPARVRDGRATFSFGSAPLAAHAPDGEARVLLRPEQILLTHGAVGARVEQVHFYGHDASVRVLLLPDGPALVARVSGLEAPEPGSEVGVAVTGPVVAFPAHGHPDLRR